MQKTQPHSLEPHQSVVLLFIKPRQPRETESLLYTRSRVSSVYKGQTCCHCFKDYHGPGTVSLTLADSEHHDSDSVSYHFTRLLVIDTLLRPFVPIIPFWNQILSKEKLYPAGVVCWEADILRGCLHCLNGRVRVQGFWLWGPCSDAVFYWEPNPSNDLKNYVWGPALPCPLLYQESYWTWLRRGETTIAASTFQCWP